MRHPHHRNAQLTRIARAPAMHATSRIRIAWATAPLARCLQYSLITNKQTEQTKMAKCKNCKSDATEASGLCFSCAEELACLLHEAALEFPDAGIDPSSAYHGGNK
jgi:hypothetical protein